MNGKISELELEVDDIAEIGMTMKNGMTGSIHLDYYCRPVRNQLEVIGSEGCLKWTNDDSKVVLTAADGTVEEYLPAGGFERNQLEVIGSEGCLKWTNDDSKVVLTAADGTVEEYLPAGGFERNQLFIGEMQRFIEVTAGTAAPSCTLDDGIAAQRMVDLVRRSWAEKRMLPYAEEK